MMHAEKGRPALSKMPAHEAPVVDVQSLDDKGRGLAKHEGRLYFIEHTLPGERVQVKAVRGKPSYVVAKIHRIIKASPHRVSPPCPHYGVCGGCTLQHVDAPTQVAIKQRQLEEAFERTAGIAPQQVLSPVYGPSWGYRHRARLSVRYVPSRGGVLIGFHERNSSYVADIRLCLILPPKISALIEPLHQLVAKLSMPHRVPQIEVAVGELQDTVLVLRHLTPLTTQDKLYLEKFACRWNIRWWTQSGGPDTAVPLQLSFASADVESPLAYHLPEFGLRIPFRPTDFIQANLAVNRTLVARALGLLKPQPSMRIADLFCGLGNFTLPIACSGAHVVGFEASESLLERARNTASQHGLGRSALFKRANLFEIDAGWLRAQGHFDAILLDPPREGARAVAEALTNLPYEHRPPRIVYVSCNPATLARDAAILVHKGGYSLRKSGVVNMFPQTAHIEAVSLFELPAE